MTIALITHPECLLHNPGIDHPESPERLRVISKELGLAGLEPFLIHEIAPLVSHEQLSRVHTEDYIESLLKLTPHDGVIAIDADTVISPHTLLAARYAAGAVVSAVDLVLSNRQINTAFCNVRPPGHHAERARAMGFCFFNNVAVGVAHALALYHLKRVAIIDFDAHLGNGTEDIFQNNKKVLICSIYQQNLYPYSDPPVQAKNIIHIPLEASATGREFRAEIIQSGLDKIKAFKPELIFISAGFDGHKQDHLSDLNLTEFDYLWISQQIRQIANLYSHGRIVSVLEGGYALNVLGQCVAAHLKGLLEQ